MCKAQKRRNAHKVSLTEISRLCLQYRSTSLLRNASMFGTANTVEH